MAGDGVNDVPALILTAAVSASVAIAALAAAGFTPGTASSSTPSS